jgi:hypothetical protein
VSCRVHTVQLCWREASTFVCSCFLLLACANSENVDRRIRTAESARQDNYVSSEKPGIWQMNLSELSRNSLLSIELMPVVVSAGESFLVTISLISPRGNLRIEQLGSFAFYPPPQAGVARSFIFRAPSALDGRGLKASNQGYLEVDLVPIERNDRLKSVIRIVGVHVVPQNF